MAITLVSPVAGYRFGPGMLVSASTSTVGPYPVDSYWVADLTDDATGQLLARGSFVNVFSGPTASLVTGILQTPLTGLPQPLTRGSADGAACSLTLVYKQHSGVFIDGPTTFPGFHWDAVSGLLYLLHDSSAGSLADILNAVRRVY